MKPVFGDTFYFLAYLNEMDARHAQALTAARQFHGRIVTTHWVLTELADAFAKSVTAVANTRGAGVIGFGYIEAMVVGAIATCMGNVGARTIREFQETEIIIAPAIKTEGKVFQTVQGVGMGSK